MLGQAIQIVDFLKSCASQFVVEIDKRRWAPKGEAFAQHQAIRRRALRTPQDHVVQFHRLGRARLQDIDRSVVDERCRHQDRLQRAAWLVTALDSAIEERIVRVFD